jgi:enoyl-CoA hydratase/carnithine racemase
MALEGSIAVLRLNRPEKLNALDYEMIDRLQSLLDVVEQTETLRVAILTGTGSKAFSAGADIDGFSSSVHGGVDRALREFVGRGQALTKRIENFPKPIIAAVNGLAFGGGCEVVEACPLAIASDDVQFAKPEMRLGFPPPFGGTQRLPRLIGRKRALKLILTGDAISAHEAVNIGLINEAVPPTELMLRAKNLASRIIRLSPVAVSACLASVTRGINLSIDEGLAMEASQFARTALTSDIREGIRAFREKREPRFVGH